MTDPRSVEARLRLALNDEVLDKMNGRHVPFHLPLRIYRNEQREVLVAALVPDLEKREQQIRAKLEEIRDEMSVAASVCTPSPEQWREWGIELEAVLASLTPAKEETT